MKKVAFVHFTRHLLIQLALLIAAWTLNAEEVLVTSLKNIVA